MKLAAAGQSASTILARYFPGTQIGSYGPRLTSAPRETPTIAAPPPRDTRSMVLPVPPVPAAREAPASAGGPASAAPPDAATSRSGALVPSASADSVALPSDIAIAVPAFASGERDGLGALIGRERQTLAQVLGVTVPRVRVRAHETNEAYERATGQPWFTLGAVASDEISSRHSICCGPGACSIERCGDNRCI